MNAQPSILAGVPRVARYLSFSNRPDAKCVMADSILVQLSPEPGLKEIVTLAN
jgi:hypothetical protein